MCHLVPVTKFYNLYHSKHSLDRIQNTVVSDVGVNTHTVGVIHKLYDLMTVQLRYDYGIYKNKKIADIILPAYIDEEMYNKIMSDVEKYVNSRPLNIVEVSNDFVYLYDKNECINLFINNLILYNQINHKIELHK